MGMFIQKNAKAFYPEETKEFDLLLLILTKRLRDLSPIVIEVRMGIMLFLMEAGPPKLAQVLASLIKDGERLYNAFWEANPCDSSFERQCEKFWNTTGQKKWLPAIDGRRLMTRKKNAL